ncbi:AbiH family protein [Salinivibrio kushneri]|uniref:AbiH family protein n=1 Tax=Salinivibrio kushneri TaxID=1908198 RepID=UPI0022B5C22E|nr:AbiH family protein [Salinivibrio kushneri]WBA12874.1 AbiH family protein [Salinivibrio kushneri]
MSEKANDIIYSIQTAFCHWVSQIDVKSANKSLNIDLDARFLSFNYTSTLQSVYKVCDTKVTHIHGSVKNYDELIFGHGRDKLIVPEFDEDGESLRCIFSDAEEYSRGPLNQLKKPVDEIIDRNKALFRSYEKVSDIKVIGHSLNSIDVPYFKKISSYAKNAIWTVYYYHEDEIPRAREALETCGVRAQKNKFINIKEIKI